MNTCCTCYDPKLDSLIYGIKFTLDNLAVNVSQKILNGYSCDNKAMDKAIILQDYLRVLESENESISLGGVPCLNCDGLQQLSEKVRRLTTSCDISSRKDLIVDHSNVESWISANPYCVSREKWEKIAYTICKAFNLEIEKVDEVCDLTFEVVRNIIPCDIILAISIFEQMCDLKLKVDRDEQECKIDFNILATETKCDIDFKTYKKLIDCNLSFDIIKTIYENGCEIEIQGGEILLLTALNKYPIKDLKFTGIPNMDILKKLNVDTSKSKYLKNPKEFITKLKSDYGKSA